MVEDEPSISSLNWGWVEADLHCVPPCTPTRLEQRSVASPVFQIWRTGYPDIAPFVRNGPMDQDELPMKSPRKERGVLVFRLHRQTKAIEGAEILGGSERYTRPRLRERRIRYDVPLELWNVRNSWVLHSP